MFFSSSLFTHLQGANYGISFIFTQFKCCKCEKWGLETSLELFDSIPFSSSLSDSRPLDNGNTARCLFQWILQAIFSLPFPAVFLTNQLISNQTSSVSWSARASKETTHITLGSSWTELHADNSEKKRRRKILISRYSFCTRQNYWKKSKKGGIYFTTS